MSYPQGQGLQWTMADQEGAFCAACLEHIPRYGRDGKQWSRHHVFRTADVETKFGFGVCDSYWIPAHRNCHEQELDPWGVEIWKSFTKFQSLAFDEQQRITSRKHSQGDYGGALLGNGHILRDHAKTIDEGTREELLTYAYSSASGIRWPAKLLASLPQSRTRLPSAMLLFSKGNERSAHGQTGDAKELLRAADQAQRRLSPLGRRRLLPTAHRREATYVENCPTASSAEVLEGLLTSKLAVRNATDHYTYTTALLAHSTLLRAKDRPVDACKMVSQLGVDPSVTWYHRARVWWAEGMLGLLRRERVDDVYQKLVTAQYVLVFFGHEPQMRILASKQLYDTGPVYGYGPGHALLNAPELSVDRLGGPERMFELRRQSISEKLREELRKCVLFE